VKCSGNYEGNGPVGDGATAQQADISSRAYGGAGNAIAIGDLVVNSETTKPVLRRAAGPTLATQELDVVEVLQDPMIEVHDARHGNAAIAANDNWGQPESGRHPDGRCAGRRHAAHPRRHRLLGIIDRAETRRLSFRCPRKRTSASGSGAIRAPIRSR
jgi:hypothetical protein